MQAGITLLTGAAGEFSGWDGARMWSRAMALADLSERLGFTFLYVPDHLQSVIGDEDAPSLEAYALLGSLAERTQRVRLGAGVTCAGFRNPGLLVRMITTLDLASDGRMDLTLGAGWHEREWRSYGYGFPPTRERLRHLEDALEITARMLRPGRATWQGPTASVDDAIAEPKGLQQPRIPIIVGGNGPNVTWRLAARHADELNLDGPSVDVIRSWLPTIRQRCEEIGRAPDSLPVSAMLWWDGLEGAERVERLEELVELGLSRVHTLFIDAADTDEPIISFAEDCRAAGLEMLDPGPAQPPERR